MASPIVPNPLMKTRSDPTTALIQKLQNTGFFRIMAYMDDLHRVVFEITVMEEHPSYRSEWKHKRVIDPHDAGAISADDGELWLEEQLFIAVCEVLKTIGDSTVGQYPATRLFAELVGFGRRGWLFNPRRVIDGYIHNKYRGHEPRDEFLKPANDVEFRRVSRDTSEMGDDPAFQQELARQAAEDDEEELQERLRKSLVLAKLEDIDDKEIWKGLEVADTAKKIVKKPKAKRDLTPAPLPIDPSKTKRKKCFKHTDTDMKFDPVSQKWRCPAPGCKVTARPVKDDDDRSVTVGKGDTMLRVVATDDEVTVLLISDNNIALNITPLIDVEDFLNRSGILDAAKIASESGRGNFVDTTERQLNLSMKVGVIGSDALVDQYIV